ncbi:uncharacterized protein LOC128720702 [Anopheles nili]|uniref:uncharacterized protein LOC128720702 n=1 Tax=Anopheles nili TaxID=185578 RepID=UPI00237C200C|nr:uncharacterized protein LOC128720702 [Anopheles nili]
MFAKVIFPPDQSPNNLFNKHDYINSEIPSAYLETGPYNTVNLIHVLVQKLVFSNQDFNNTLSTFASCLNHTSTQENTPEQFFKFQQGMKMSCHEFPFICSIIRFLLRVNIGPVYDLTELIICWMTTNSFYCN